jgi:Uma2 family endonuclease
VNLPKEIIEIYTQPKNGKYQKVQRLKRGKSLVSPTVAGLSLSVDDILG